MNNGNQKTKEAFLTLE